MRKKIFNNYSCIALAAIFAVALGGCTKGFKDLNTNPNQPTDGMLNYDNVKVGGFFIQLEKNVRSVGSAADGTGPVNNYQIAYNLASDNWSGYMGIPQSAKFNNGNNFTTYFFITNWNDGAFSTMYTSIFNPYIQIRSNVDSAKTPEIVALANIIKIAGLHQATDTYGPIAYTGVGSGNLTNPYESQQAVYDHFFSELTSAITVLSNYQAANNSILPNYDAVYGGDVSKWIRFANSLMLRLAMRISYADAPNAQKYAEQAVNNPFGVITNVADGAQLSQGAGLVFQNPINTIWDGYGDIRMGASLLSFLNGYSDPRLPAYAQAATVGGTQGYYGVRTGFITGDFTSFSKPNIQLSTPTYWLRASEVSFLRAEGALRNWNMGGTPSALYNEGITKSFTENGVGAGNYVNNSTSTPAAYVNALSPAQNTGAASSVTIQWNEASSFELKLERIITQKYIANFPNGQEAWSEYRRTGYPKLFPIINNTSGGTVPTASGVRRMPFPPSEYSTNGKNISDAVANLLGGGADNGGTKVWWDKK